MTKLSSRSLKLAKWQLLVLTLAIFSVFGLTILYFASASTSPTSNVTNRYSIHIVAGQSNAVGYGAYANELPPNKDDQKIKFYYKDDGVSSGGMTTLKSQSVPLVGNVFGPEMTLGRSLYRVGVPNPVIIKVAKGGSNLENDWDPQTGMWFANLRTAVNEVTASIRANGGIYTFDGFYWMQGETDGSNAAFAAAYEANLRSFIASTRSMVGNTKMPFIMGRINSPKGIPVSVEQVRQAQIKVAATTPSTQWVNTDNLPFVADSIHFNSQGELTLGNLFYLKAQPFLQQQYSLSPERFKPAR